MSSQRAAAYEAGKRDARQELHIELLSLWAVLENSELPLTGRCSVVADKLYEIIDRIKRPTKEMPK